MNENLEVARYECQLSVKAMAIQIIARDRRIAQALVDAERRTEERRKEVQIGVQRDATWGW